VNIALSEEQEALAEEARAFLDERPGPEWHELAALGWTGVSVEEALGGAGLGFVEEAILFEETGRALLHAPFYSTVALALPALPDELRSEVARGEASWTVALGPLLTDLDTAARVAVVDDDGIYELEGCERAVRETTDSTRPVGIVAGGRLGRRLAGREVLPQLRRRSLVALAFEACGVGRRALELAIEHACRREQFGRPIGSYQAVSHPLATSYTELELARSTALWAAWCLDMGDPQADVAAAAAKSLAADAAVGACERAIQAHGGIGFTWEHVLQRLYKRALWTWAWEPSGAELRAEVAAYLLDGSVFDEGSVR
jgi:alkylation response protein AidB-like acyl-CoA dehydrogenase